MKQKEKNNINGIDKRMNRNTESGIAEIQGKQEKNKLEWKG